MFPQPRHRAAPGAVAVRAISQSCFSLRRRVRSPRRGADGAAGPGPAFPSRSCRLRCPFLTPVGWFFPLPQAKVSLVKRRARRDGRERVRTDLLCISEGNKESLLEDSLSQPLCRSCCLQVPLFPAAGAAAARLPPTGCFFLDVAGRRSPVPTPKMAPAASRYARRKRPHSPGAAGSGRHAERGGLGHGGGRRHPRALQEQVRGGPGAAGLGGRRWGSA